MKRFLLLLPLSILLSVAPLSAQDTLDTTICTFNTSAPDSTLILVRDYVNKVRHDWQIPGLSLSIVKDGSLVFAEGFGVREKGRSVAKDGEEVAITENTIFHIGSISKSFTAAVMASVVDDGLVNWDDPVKEIMPDFDWWDNDVEKTLKVKDLFTHSTGLVAQVGTYIPNLGYDREDIYQMLHYMQPWYQVGEKFAYNNITFIIAARIIEKVTGKSWEDNVRERIFIPLGMTSSSLGEEGYLAAGKNGSIAHDFRYAPTKDGRGRMRITPLYGEERALHWVTVIGPAGGISSTAVDMSKWVKFHLDMGKVASPPSSTTTDQDSIQVISRNNMGFLHPDTTFTRQDSIQVISRNNMGFLHPDTTFTRQDSIQVISRNNMGFLHPDTTFTRQDSIQVISRNNMEFLHTGTTFVRQDSTSVRHYGYCWYVENNDRYDLIYHTGTTWGFTAICGFVPDLHLGFALLCNSEVSEYARFAIMRRIIDLYLVKRDREIYTDSIPETDSIPKWPTYDSLYDWNSHFLTKWFADKKKPSKRNVPCTIKRSKEVPEFSKLTGTYHKPAPFGNAKVSLENGKLYLTIGPKGWKHQLKHRSGNEFWMSSGGHTYPVFFHNYSSTSTTPTDFEIDFNYNENFGPWTK